MRRFVLAVFVAVALAACRSSLPPRSAQPPPAAADATAAALRRTREATTGRFEVAITATDATRAVSVTATGAYDLDARRYTLSVRPPDHAAITVIALDGAVYVSDPDLSASLAVPTAWVRIHVPLDELLGPLGVDPTGLLDSTDGATVEIGPDGLVERITMRFDSSAEGGSAVVSVRYFDVGQPIVIAPPPDADVTDEAGG